MKDVLRKRGEIWVSEKMLMANCKLSSEYIRIARSRFKESLPKKATSKFPPDTGISWRWAKVDGVYYYDYKRIPPRYQAQLPPADELRGGGALVPRGKWMDVIRQAVEHGYRDYMHAYPGYPEAKTVQLAKAAAVLQAAIDYVRDSGYDVRRASFYVEFVQDITHAGVPYLPSTHRILKDKVLKVIQGGAAITEVIDLPRLGNRNAKKYDDPEIVAWLFQMRNMPQNYTNSHIIRKLRFLCELAVKPKPSVSWFNNELAKPFTKYLTADGRFGRNGRRGGMYKGYIPVENAMFAGDCWQADGTRVNLIGHKGKDGRQEFLYIIAVRDVYSGDILGWHLDTKEDRWGWICAIKMAVAVSGYLPYELVADKFPGHNTPEWETVERRLLREGMQVTKTSTATGKARIERMFGTLQTVFMQDSDYYYGEGIQSRRDYAHRSAEYLAHMQRKANKDGWDFDAAFQEANRIIEAYRSTPLSHYSRKYASIELSPRELHAQCERPHTTTVEPWTFVELFGLEKRVRLRSQGLIKTEIQRIEYMYTVQEYSTISHYRDVAICYDMDDLSTVYLFEASEDVNRKYLGEAHEQRKVQMYGPGADRKTGKMKARLKDLEERRKADLEAITKAGSEVELLLGSYTDKAAASSAENEWLTERIGEWKDTGKAKVLVTVPVGNTSARDDEDDEVDIDIRSMY
jgi:hypothetical protein